ncbi:MAG: outer membrane beta-barrel protein [Candidatus Sulfotelmatobacter sp.]
MSAANTSASSAVPTEQQEMREELKALRAEVERLRTEVEQQKNTAPISARSEPVPATTGVGPNVPSATAANVAGPPVAAASGQPAAVAVTSTPDAAPGKKPKIDPFSDWDWTWLNGNPRTKEAAFDSKFFTPEIRADVSYTYDFNKPKDNSMGGSSEIFRSNEIQLEQLGVGGDFHFDNVRARLMTQFGMYSTTTPRNDPSPGKGQWDLADAYRYVSEAYGGYHINALNGINIDAGIFMSYIGLFSYYNFDNWAYQPSYVSSNTPWFFNGLRVQIFPNPHLKIEPWFINGWQSYGSANSRKGLGGQIKWTPRPWVNIVSNNYGLGHDDLYIPNRSRIHTDDSIEIKYYDHPERTLDKMAFTFTGDLGCEFGGGVSCHNTGGKNTATPTPKQSFIGYMLYNRTWFKKDRYGVTIGGGQINNPGRYLVLIPPINGETAITAASNSPYFTGNPGDPFKAWDTSATFDYMPSQYITFRWEYDYRHASVPYWSGAGGITPPPGTNNGFPQDYACISGATSGQTTLSAAQTACGGAGNVWFPDLRRDEHFIDMAILVKF